MRAGVPAELLSLLQAQGTPDSRFGAAQRGAMWALGERSGWLFTRMTRKERDAIRQQHSISEALSAPACTLSDGQQRGQQHPLKRLAWTYRVRLWRW